MSTTLTGVPVAPPRGASVADQLAFDALPEETRALVERLYGRVPAVGGQWFTREQMEDMYETGFEDGQDSVDVQREPMSRRRVEECVKNFIEGRRG